MTDEQVKILLYTGITLIVAGAIATGVAIYLRNNTVAGDSETNGETTDDGGSAQAE